MENKKAHNSKLLFNGDNTYPECECCGDCCHIAVLSITDDELAQMHEYIDANDIVPIDRGYERCPLRGDDGKCMVWEARPKICKLYNCKVPRHEIVREDPALDIADGTPLVVLYEEFIGGEAPIETKTMAEGFKKACRD